MHAKVLPAMTTHFGSQPPRERPGIRPDPKDRGDHPLHHPGDGLKARFQGLMKEIVDAKLQVGTGYLVIPP